MALFERPDASHLPLLFRLGFHARLRWELSDTFITVAPNISATTSRPSATFFHFQTNEICTSTSFLVTVQTPPSFLTLTPAPAQTTTPTLLRLSIADDPSIHRTLVSLQQPGPAGKYLTLNQGRASLTPQLSKHCLFHLEICLQSIAKDATTDPAADLRFVYPVQAFTYSLLSLGVRFRLRSVHNRVLRTAKHGQQHVVLQNGPRTQLAETHQDEICFTAFKVARTAPDAQKEPRAVFCIVDVGGDKALSIADDNLTQVDTAAVLKNDNDVCIHFANGWGAVHVGDEKALKWLMAGQRGRLEVREHRKGWETFTLEFVKQSLDMTLKELPPSTVYQKANEETRKVVREQIARSIAIAKGDVGQKSNSENVKSSQTKAVTAKKGKVSVSKGTFNHAAALSGLSDPVDETKEQAKRDAEKIKAKEKEEREAKAIAAAVATSALPRNKANRKAAKRNKKKQQGKAVQKAVSKGAASKPASAPVRPDNAVNGTVDGAASSKSGSEKNSNNAEARPSANSTENKSTPPSIGPPCGACGRIIDGPYTTALGKNFHPQCFCCGQCRRPMGMIGGQFRERGGIPYCQSCFAIHVAPKCARCGKPILETVITAMDKTWHKECLTCTICRLPLTQTFWLYADKPNEPRCSRCVTGSEDGLANANGNRQLVNLPMFGMGKNAPTLPAGTGTSVGGSSSVGHDGRARLMTPVLPVTGRR